MYYTGGPGRGLAEKRRIGKGIRIDKGDRVGVREKGDGYEKKREKGIRIYKENSVGGREKETGGICQGEGRERRWGDEEL